MNQIHRLAMIGAALMMFQVLVARELATVFGNTLNGVTLAMNLGLLGLAAGLILVTVQQESQQLRSQITQIRVFPLVSDCLVGDDPCRFVDRLPLADPD